MSAPGVQLATPDDPRFVAAHRALRSDGAIQFDLQAANPPAKAPDWLRTLGEWVDWVLRPIWRALRYITDMMPPIPLARIILWVLIAAALLAVLWIVVDRIRNGQWRWPRLRRGRKEQQEADDAEPWAPAQNAARQWLTEADALAAAGDYAEAIHHLLWRSVEDIAKQRPALVRPASTGRALAANEAIPRDARVQFGRIAALVERSLFAQRAVDADDWSSARQAYADFASAYARPA